jgi:hypothetical protein
MKMKRFTKTSRIVGIDLGPDERRWVELFRRRCLGVVNCEEDPRSAFEAIDADIDLAHHNRWSFLDLDAIAAAGIEFQVAVAKREPCRGPFLKDEFDFWETMVKWADAVLAKEADLMTLFSVVGHDVSFFRDCNWIFAFAEIRNFAPKVMAWPTIQKRTIVS